MVVPFVNLSISLSNLSDRMRRLLAAYLLPLALVGCSDVRPPAGDSSIEADYSQWSDWADSNPSWVEAVSPFRIIDSVYFVGTRGLSSFLITSSDGHVIIDGGLPQNAPVIVENIEKLGFDIRDVRALLNSHAHFDHSGGLAELRAASGAMLYASEGDRAALEGGFSLGDEDDQDYAAPPVPVDSVVVDGDQVRLGDIELTARLTPGHTRGCTSWWLPVEVNGQSLDVLFFCSATVAGNRLVPPQYDGMVEDYRRTFSITKDWQPDVFLANHPSFFDFDDKRSALAAGDSMAFVDKVGFSKLMERLEASFESALASAQAE